MGNTKLQKCRKDFYKFVSFRNRFSLFLALIVFVCYYAFVAVIGFFPHVLGYRLGPSAITLGVICGISIIVLCIILTGIYTFFANKYLDKEQERILKECEDAGVLEQLQQGK